MAEKWGGEGRNLAVNAARDRARSSFGNGITAISPWPNLFFPTLFDIISPAPGQQVRLPPPREGIKRFDSGLGQSYPGGSRKQVFRQPRAFVRFRRFYSNRIP